MRVLLCFLLIHICNLSLAQNVNYVTKLKASFVKNKFIGRPAKTDTTFNSYKQVFDYYVSKINETPKYLKDSSVKILRNDSLDAIERRQRINLLTNHVLDTIDEIVSNAFEVIYSRNKARRLQNSRDTGNGESFSRASLKVPYKKFGRYFQSFQTQRFFENDTTHKEFFQTNNVNYSPRTRQLSLYTEVINDYFGPVRVGAGFQLAPKTNQDNADSANKKNIAKHDLVAQLQNAGAGTFSVNLAYPICENKNNMGKLNFRLYAYHNTGLSFDTIGAPNTSFIANSNSGLKLDLFAKGSLQKIIVFSQMKVGYFFGNKRFREVLTEADGTYPSSFLLTKLSGGLSFGNVYKVSIDFYPHFGNAFVKSNFQTAFTFSINP